MLLTRSSERDHQGSAHVATLVKAAAGAGLRGFRRPKTVENFGSRAGNGESGAANFERPFAIKKVIFLGDSALLLRQLVPFQDWRTRLRIRRGIRLRYNRRVKTWDVVVIGAGVIGLSLAWRLRQGGVSVLVVEKGEPWREASSAAGGMIASCDPGNPPELAALIAASARMYRGFVDELRAEAFQSPDLRDTGTILFPEGDETPDCERAIALDDAALAELEPGIALRGRAYWLPESSIDPHKLCRALEKAARTRGVDFVTGAPVTEVAVLGGRATGVRTAKAFYAAEAVVNCAGAWASQIKPLGVPTHPVKGQIVCLVPAAGADQGSLIVQHVIRTPEVYIIPRSDGRILLGATLEDARLRQAR